MRDMKAPYKIIENFKKDPNLMAQAQKAALELRELSIMTAKMKPAFLNAEQHTEYEKYFIDG